MHVGVAAAADQRGKLERLCRSIARPAVAIERLSLSAQGHIRYALKTPYRDGTTHVLFEPLDFLARLAALVPSPGVNLTRYHGVFAPNHRLRARIVPGNPPPTAENIAAIRARYVEARLRLDAECLRSPEAVPLRPRLGRSRSMRHLLVEALGLDANS